MNTFSLRAVCAAAGFAALGLPMWAHAESVLTTGTGSLTATANLDFRVVVPKVLYLRVGTTGAANINVLNFNVSSANVGDSTPVAGTGGDFLGSGVNAHVRANGTGVTLMATTTGPLTSPTTTSTLSFSEFGTTVAANTVTRPTLAAPALTDGGSNTVSVAATGNITDSDATWTFSYLNTALLPHGTYGGAANNGRVVYTATMP